MRGWFLSCQAARHAAAPGRRKARRLNGQPLDVQERDMSSWNDPAQWQRYLSREGCLVCNQTPETRPPTERLIADMSVSRLTADSTACLKGHCCLVLKPHVIEIY